MELSEKAKQLRNAYQREYRRKNPDKLQKYNLRYWERKAEKYTPDVEAKRLQLLGYSQRQIAEYLNISLGAVNNLLNKN